ncbi:hypothetical protein CCR94_11855 [Rhodoblastus sphagnicola]|uniref:Uncharacterized protein n=1 Tax=Rhodoblastus sphagnicola TaxID=333368 RepID=A0A2S6N814_9HYPH|nr:hypothetical protein [Rhodoblastus sphagnicola]MBB4197779.1 hypothetical protein [Rhodoblastus sphagnicola]PPQ30748.1 hypothetical protein CCR94_11855 [Rhodoblastus sphagnicola]
MPSIPVANLTEQGQDMVIVIMDPRFVQANPSQQEAVIGQLQARSDACGLKGTVALVWDGGGWMDYLAPQPWHDFFRGVTLDDVRARINAAITWQS